MPKQFVIEGLVWLIMQNEIFGKLTKFYCNEMHTNYFLYECKQAPADLYIYFISTIRLGITFTGNNKNTLVYTYIYILFEDVYFLTN